MAIFSGRMITRWHGCKRNVRLAATTPSLAEQVVAYFPVKGFVIVGLVRLAFRDGLPIQGFRFLRAPLLQSQVRERQLGLSEVLSGLLAGCKCELPFPVRSDLPHATHYLHQLSGAKPSIQRARARETYPHRLPSRPQGIHICGESLVSPRKIEEEVGSTHVLADQLLCPRRHSLCQFP